jgi:hypothetical protein
MALMPGLHNTRMRMHGCDSSDPKPSTPFPQPSTPFPQPFMGPGSLFQPYFPLNELEYLLKPKNSKPDGTEKTNKDDILKAFLIGTTNRMLAYHPQLLPDVLIDMSSGTLHCYSPEMKEILSLTVYDRLFIDRLLFLSKRGESGGSSSSTSLLYNQLHFCPVEDYDRILTTEHELQFQLAQYLTSITKTFEYYLTSEKPSCKAFKYA